MYFYMSLIRNPNKKYVLRQKLKKKKKTTYKKETEEKSDILEHNHKSR